MTYDERKRRDLLPNRVEAELARIEGDEEAALPVTASGATDPDEAKRFVRETAQTALPSRSEPPRHLPATHPDRRSAGMANQCGAVWRLTGRPDSSTLGHPPGGVCSSSPVAEEDLEACDRSCRADREAMGVSRNDRDLFGE